MMIACVCITWISVKSLKNSIENQVETSMKIASSSLSETYENLYEGDYQMGKSGKVSKGDVVISGDNNLVDAMKEKTGFEMSLLFDNKRLVTTVVRSTGKRSVFSNIDEKVSRGMVGRIKRIKDFLDLIIKGRLDHVPNRKGMKTVSIWMSSRLS